MGNCFLHGNGGGTSLNYEVVRYASEADLPETAKENIVAVFSDVEISSHIFAVTEPAEPVQGMVWFLTGTSSTVAFNALKKNGIQIYPISAKQYVDGAWVAVTAKSYQDGEWVDWGFYLYKDGNEFADTTGGWSPQFIFGAYVASGGVVTKESDHIYIKGVAGSSLGIVTNGSCDLSQYSRLGILYTSNGPVGLNLATSFPENDASTAVGGGIFPAGIEVENYVDLTGINVYSKIGIYDNGAAGVYIYKIWLE